VGQRGVGTVTIASGGVLNWQTSGSTEQRFMFGNGISGVGILNLNGGVLHNYFDTAQALTDAERQFRAGSDGGTATINLNSGSWLLEGNVPFALGCKYQNLNTTPAIVQSTTVSTINITDGSLVFSGIISTLNATKSTFTVGSNDKINFLSSGSGKLSIQGWLADDFLSLATAGRLQIDGSDVANLGLLHYESTGGQGILSVPEPGSATLAEIGLLMGMRAVRRRKQ
jgi:hypothetical protein